MSRTDARLTPYAAITPTTIHIACDLYAPAAMVLTSVCPAENTIARPYSDSTIAPTINGTSTLIRRVAGISRY